MSVRHASSPVRFARWAVAASLVVILGAVAWVLCVRRARPRPAAPETAAPAAARIDRKEGIQHLEYKDGRVWADVRADRFFLGGDAMNHLEGRAEIWDYEGPEGRRIRILADSVVYDPAMIHFTIAGHVRITSGDLRFESDSFDYDKSLRMFRTTRGGVVTSDRLSGSGREFSYAEDAHELRISGGVRFEVRDESRPSGAVQFSGDRLIYLRKEKRGRIEGRGRVQSGSGDGSANLLGFELSPDERYLLSATLEGEARCGSRGEGRGYNLEAGSIRILTFPRSSGISSLEALKDCRISLSDASGPGADIRSGAARLTFDRAGRLAGWLASGGAAMDAEEKGGGPRQFEGEEISWTDEPRMLGVRGAPGGDARLDSADSRIEAPSIRLDGEEGNVRAAGGVRGLMKPRSGGAALGFFPRDSSLFIACKEMTSSEEGRRVLFEGNARIWQGERSLQAGSIEVFEKTEEIMGRGGVTAGLLHSRPRAAADERVEVAAEAMDYSPQDRTIVFHGQGSVVMPEARLAAKTIFVALREDKRAIQGLRAEGEVTVSEGDWEGRSDKAVYDPDADTVVLTGRPSLVEKGKGTSRGDKLTFHLGDGRILIENKGQGRSISIVKS